MSIIFNKKILGTEPSVGVGNLGLFAASDEKFYVKQSDGTTYPIFSDSYASASTFTLKAHSSLTTDDIGKFIISYTDPSWNDWVANYLQFSGNPTYSNFDNFFSGFTGSLNEARVAFLTGTTSGQNGVYTIDFTQTYNGITYSGLSQSDYIIYVDSENDATGIKVENLNFQPDDPYLAPIIGSLTWSESQYYSPITFSFTDDPNSLAILLDYYFNNGIPDNYSADERFGAFPPYHITTTFSFPFAGSTYSGTSVQFQITKTLANFNQVEYYRTNPVGIGFTPSADVTFIYQNDYAYLAGPVVGTLYDLQGNTALIQSLPDIITAKSSYGILGFKDTPIFSLAPTTNLTGFIGLYLALFDSYFIGGPDEMVPFIDLFNCQNFSAAFGFMLNNSPIYQPLDSGFTGEYLKFKRVTTTPFDILLLGLIGNNNLIQTNQLNTLQVNQNSTFSLGQMNTLNMLLEKRQKYSSILRNLQK